MLKTTRQFAVLAASVSALMLAPYAHAQDADKTAAIKELLTVMQADRSSRTVARCSSRMPSRTRRPCWSRC